MKKLLFTLLFSGAMTSFAQPFTNGGFENWTNNPINFPQYYVMNSNYDNMNWGFPSNVTKVTDAQAGSFAVNLQTISNATDTSFAYIVNGDPMSWAGGIPYTEKPTTLTGFYKSNVMVGDTALLFVAFKEAGAMLSFDVYQFYGTQSTYAAFNLTINLPGGSNPDSVIIGAVSSNAFVSSGIPGSMLQLDNLSFTGVTSQPTNLNGSFENWSTINLYKPDSWVAMGDTSFRTTDKVSGTYALQLTTVAYSPTEAGGSVATNGTIIPSMGPAGGRPYTLTADTLYGMYKFIPAGLDSATIWINLTNGGSPVGGNYVGLPPVAVYTPFSIPIAAGTAPDTMLIVIGSSYGMTDISNAGSKLFIDDLYLKSQPLNTPQLVNWNAFGKISVYPNPAELFTTVSFTSASSIATKINVIDASGKLVMETSVTGIGNQNVNLNLDGMPAGNYTVRLSQNGQQQVRKLIIK